MSKRIESMLVKFGYGNRFTSSKAVAILLPESAPPRRLKEDEKERNMLIDTSPSRTTRSIIITDSARIILTAVRVEALTRRFFGGEGT